MPPATESFVEVPGGRLFVVDEGEGPPILLLHAGIAALQAWDTLVPELIAAGYRTIRYDLRGFGRSETQVVPFSNRADAIAVLDALGVGRACLVGNSMGGQIAIDTAVEYPDRVAALVALGAGLGGFDGSLTPEELEVEEAVEALEAAGDIEALVAAQVRLWGDGVLAPEGRMAEPARSQLVELVRGAADPDRPRGTPIPLDPPAAGRVGALAIAVVAVVGALDETYAIQVAEHLGTAAPHGRTVILPDVAHMIAMERPVETARLIAETLAPLGAFG